MLQARDVSVGGVIETIACLYAKYKRELEADVLSSWLRGDSLVLSWGAGCVGWRKDNSHCSCPTLMGKLHVDVGQWLTAGAELIDS